MSTKETSPCRGRGRPPATLIAALLEPWIARLGAQDLDFLSLLQVNVVRAVLDGALATPAAVGFVAPVISDPPQRGPRVGERWEYAVSHDDGVAVFAHGLPGAGVEAGTVHWRPMHPGWYDAVVGVTGPRGFASRSLAIEVVNAHP